MDSIEGILEYKRSHNIVVFAHNYQSPEIQAIADCVGDTFYLAVKANDIECDAIVFCGPDFMVEMTALLNPDKKVVYANPAARCPLAAMCSGEDIEMLRKEYPGVPIVGYLNTSMDCRSKVDICCGSRNCLEVVRSLDSHEVIVIPDENLAAYIQRCVPEKKIISWLGFCAVHEYIKAEDVAELKRLHPKAEVLVHPECTPEVASLATAVLSTNEMVERAMNSASDEFIIVTENELIHRLTEAAPTKKFYILPKAVCHTQKKITLHDVIRAIETLEPEVKLDAQTVIDARRPLEKMLTLDALKNTNSVKSEGLCVSSSL
jgi:quinolinate synthase